MNKKVTLKKILEDDLKNYENVSLNDENKLKGLNAISKEMNLIMSEEKQNKDFKLREKQLEIDSEKLELSKKQFELEQYSKTFELKLKEESMNNEKEKLNAELELKEKELKTVKRRETIAIVTTVGTFVVSLVSKIIYAKLTLNAQRHDYEDYKLESPSSREQRNNLLNK